MPGITAIHHPLGDVDSGTGYIQTLIDIDGPVDWPAMNTHTEANVGVAFDRSANLHRAFDGCFRVIEEDQRHAIARR